jgi:hypothetical protein
MSENLKDILSNLSPDIDQETLLLYLQDKLSGEKKHELEKQILENEFENDALEGLQEIRDQKRIPALTEQLNRYLRKKLEKKRRLRRKFQINEQPWLYITILIIILLIILSYFAIHKLLQQPS